jgi:hypothetical protein
MDMSKYGTKKTFIGVADLRDGPQQKTIIGIAEGQYGKPVASFEDGRKLTINPTNNDILMGAYGADDADWIGMTVELAAGLRKYNGGDIDSVIVKPISPAKPPEARKPVPKQNDMDDDIPFSVGAES